MTTDDPIQRLHYFDHQFLREEDFNDEQAYHVRMRRLHNGSLHTWGIASGLLPNASVNDASVTISPGVAIDSQGREIVLTTAGSADLSGVTGATARRVIITISYREQQDIAATDPGVTGFTRWKEVPLIEVRETPPSDPSLTLVLGSVEVASGKVTAVPSPRDRQAAGVVAGDLRAISATLSSNLSITGNITVSGNVDGRDLSVDGTRLDGHIASVANPHGTTAAQVGALPTVGGTVNGQVLFRTNVPAPTQPTLIATVQPNATAQPTTVTAALSAVSGIPSVLGQYVRSGSFGAIPLPANPADALRVDGNVLIDGNLRVNGNKGGYVVDTFVNGSGQRLQTGDVVRLKATPIIRFQGLNNKIPVAEVTLADQEHAAMVIGVVDQEAFRDNAAPDRRTDPDDPTFIADGGDLLVVTLGAYSHCKVDAGPAPIAVGDLLTPSPNPGFAQKALDPKLGTIIGKALEPLEQGTGYIAVFVNSQ